MPPSIRQSPSLTELFASFLRLGATAFGGPAMIAYIQKLAVTKKGWLTPEDFKNGVALCQTIPGATAMQCAAYVGWRTRGLLGAIAAFTGFGLPAFLVMVGLAIVYRRAAGLPDSAAALTGLRVIVVTLVANATWTFGRSWVKDWREALLVFLAAVFFLSGISPFACLLGAGVAGGVFFRDRKNESAGPVVSDDRSSWSPLLLLVAAAVFLVIFLAWDRKLATIALIMMKVDAFAFGGGFAALPLMLHEAVGVHGWLSSSAIMDGIALGQVTPGPIVITATFIGYQAAGAAGAVAATVGIFLPSLFIVTFVEPYFRRLQSSPTFRGVTRGLTLSFVGLLISVTIHFAQAAPWSIRSGIIAALAMAALLCKVDLLWVVLAGAVVSVILL
ncbi:MAG: chromate efflux transporter [Myxococcales bacterium]|nr:chromate efflux transporter [Myxococcales bacterium]